MDIYTERDALFEASNADEKTRLIDRNGYAK